MGASALVVVVVGGAGNLQDLRACQCVMQELGNKLASVTEERRARIWHGRDSSKLVAAIGRPLRRLALCVADPRAGWLLAKGL